MRKDGKSQYTIKKEKLLAIKQELIWAKIDLNQEQTNKEYILATFEHYFEIIWSIVENEK